MFKKFIDWMHSKKRIDSKERAETVIKEREVYWCSLGENIGDEENGKGTVFRRPVLIFKKFNNRIFWGIPMSTKNKVNIYYLKVKLRDMEQSVMLSQLRILDTKRLDTKIGYLSEGDFIKIQNSIMDIIKNKR
ncbi:MAG: type II toxin-antitoxin system PemK/MazF family toxin [bacterium]